MGDDPAVKFQKMRQYQLGHIAALRQLRDF